MAQGQRVDVTAIEEQNLRAFKSGASYCRSLLHTALGSNQVKQHDWLSAGINYYYALFHLGLAALFLRHEYVFRAESEFRWCDDRAPRQIKRAWAGSHRHLATKLKAIQDAPYCQEIAEMINEAIDLRESFSYGPWFVVEGRVPAIARPIYRRDELPNEFPPTKDLVTTIAQSAEKLLSKYPSYLNGWLNQWERSLRIRLRVSVTNALVIAPWRIGLLPSSCSDDAVMKGIADLIQVLEPKRASEVMQVLGVVQREEKRVKAIRMTFERDCPFCSSVIPADARKCPQCGLDIA